MKKVELGPLSNTNDAWAAMRDRAATYAEEGHLYPFSGPEGMDQYVYEDAQGRIVVEVADDFAAWLEEHEDENDESWNIF